MPAIRESTGQKRHRLQFSWVPRLFAIVQLAPDAPVPGWATQGEFTSITRTKTELSIVCSTDSLPPEVHSPHRWACLKLKGPFAFAQTGVLLSFIEPLSANGIPIFTVSTYDTDYVLIQEECADSALDLLMGAGHQLVS
jgi:hypothetical protein